MPLLLDYKEGDRLIINGAVIENAGVNTKILVHNQASILRGKEVLSAEESNTPASRAYFELQSAYVFSDRTEEHLKEHNIYLDQYVAACPSALPIALEIREYTEQGALYKALKSSQQLILHEQGVLGTLHSQLEEIDNSVADAEAEQVGEPPA